MPDITALLTFSLAAGLLTVAPGLDTALILRTAAVEGPRPARMAAAGICSGCLVWGSATAVGLTALLAVSALAFNAVRICGACYLVYLGLHMFFRRRDFGADLGNKTVEQRRTLSANSRRWYIRGLLTNLLNPKVGVFYITLLPQFIPRGGSVIGYSLGFTFIHVFEGLLWLTLLTIAIAPLRNWLWRPAVTRGLDRGTGAVLIGSAVALALERRR